jgi:hypothetical protein
MMATSGDHHVFITRLDASSDDTDYSGWRNRSRVLSLILQWEAWAFGEVNRSLQLSVKDVLLSPKT